MKKTLTLTIAVSVIFGSLQARTWTSAEGGKTFKGNYVSHTDDFVTVTRGLKKVRFKISLLSEDDRKWLEEKKAEASEPAEKKSGGDLGKIGEKLAGNMVKLSESKYEDYIAETVPEYYIVYYTASW